MFEEGAFSLLSHDSLGQLGELVCSIFGFLFSTVTWRSTSVSFRNFSNVIPFNRRPKELQCPTMSVMLITVCLCLPVQEQEFCCFVKVIVNSFILFCDPERDYMDLECNYFGNTILLSKN